jgi:hypothetical protein
MHIKILLRHIFTTTPDGIQQVRLNNEKIHISQQVKEVKSKGRKTKFRQEEEVERGRKYFKKAAMHSRQPTLSLQRRAERHARARSSRGRPNGQATTSARRSTSLEGLPWRRERRFREASWRSRENVSRACKGRDKMDRSRRSGTNGTLVHPQNYSRTNTVSNILTKHL